MAKNNNYKGKGKKKYGNSKGKSDVKNTSYTRNSNPKGDPRDMEDDKSKRRYEENNYTVGASTTNDPAWYMKLSRLVDDAVKISFGNQLGRTYRLLGEVLDPATIGVLHMIPLPGVARTNSDGINIASQGMFTIMRKDLATYASYTAADVMCNFYGTEQVYTLIMYILRLFGLVNVFSGINLTMPQRLIQAISGWTPNDYNTFVKNLNNYRARFNHLIYKASALYLPVDFTIMDRHAWLFSNYYVDHANKKAQIYVHTCDYVYELAEDAFTTGTALVPVPVYGQNMESLLNRLNVMIEKFRQSDSMLKITADARKAFADRQAWKLAYCDEGYMCLPSFDTNVLSQIENTVVVPKMRLTQPEVQPGTLEYTSWMKNCVTQLVDENVLVCIPNWLPTDTRLNDADKAFFAESASNRLINMHWDNPEVKDIVESTVDTVYGYYDEMDQLYELSSVNCDICDDFVIYSTESYEDYHYISPADPGLWTQMDWAPMYHQFLGTEEAPRYFAELDNFAIVEGAVLDNIHRATSLSTWSVPEFGMFDH